MNLVITPELRSHLELLAIIEPDYVSDVVLALIETINGIKQDPSEMPDAVEKIYLYWTTDGRLATLELP